MAKIDQPFAGGTIPGSVTIAGDLTVQGSFNFGDAGVDIMTVAGYIQGSVAGNTYVSFGTPATSHTLNATNDVFVGGKLEVDGVGYFDSNVEVAGTIKTNYASSAVSIQFYSYATYGAIGIYTDDGMRISVGNGDGQANRNLIIADSAWYVRDFDHDTLSANPTLFIHSATDPDVDNTQWVSLYHDGANAQMDVGLGTFNIGSVSLNQNGNITGTTISSGNGLFAKGGAAGSVILRGTPTDGSGNPAIILRSNATLATAGDKITSFDNNTVEVGYVDYQGRMAVGNGTQALPSLTFAGDSDTGFYLNTGNSVGLSEGGSQVYKWQAGSFYTAKITGNGGGTGQLTVQGVMADGASAIGVTVNAGFALTTPGSKIASFQNATVEKAYIDYQGFPAFGKNSNGDPYLALTQPVSNSAQLYLVSKNNSSRGIKLTTTQTTVGPSSTMNEMESVLGDLNLKSNAYVLFDGTGTLTMPNASYGKGEYKEVKTVQTTDATVTEVWTSAIVADNETYQVEATVHAMKTDGSDRAVYKIMGLFYRDGGNVTQQGATISIGTIESDATWDADFTVDTVNQDINVAVTGKAATTINWKAVVKYTKVTAS